MSGKVIVGTAGHIDHGKSALVRALTGTDPDRLKEEKERGITIELGFARLVLPSGTLAGVVDVPGHERFVRTMVAGAAGIDIVLLVIAADEGIMPQTREHLDICRLLGIRDGIVVLNKRDKVDPDWLALQEEEVRQFVRGTFLADAPIIPVSAVTGQGLPDLVAALDGIASRVPGKDPSLLFRLPVDRSFTMKGFGTVVTGTVVGGTIALGEEVVVLPGHAVARVRGIQVHGGAAETSAAGMRTAVNLQGIEKDSVPRGSVLVRPGTFFPTRQLDAHVEHLSIASRPLGNRTPVSFHAFTASCLGKVILYGVAGIPPGGSGYARIDLAEETVLMGGDRFILRGFAPLRNFGYTIGGGRVLSPTPPPRRGIAKAVPAALAALGSPDPVERVLAAAVEAGTKGLEAREAAIMTGISLEAAREAVERLAGTGTLRRAPGPERTRAWSSSIVAEVGRRGKSALEVLHDRFGDRTGFPVEEIAPLIPGPPDPVLVALAMESLAEIGREGDLWFLPRKRPSAVEISSPPAQAIAARVREAGLSAPTKAELAGSPAKRVAADFDKTLEALLRAGAVVRVKDLYFDPAVVGAVRKKLVTFLENRGEITVPEFKELTGLSRKYVIPLLEHFDLAKVTLRVGDKRVLRKAK